MRRFFCAIGVACGLMAAAASWSARADVLDHLWGHSGPPTLTDVAKMIDQIQRSLVNQGTVVIKQPDVWSQARMTQFRQEYEDTMAAQLTKFDAKLAGRIARSDTASFNSQTTLAASISPVKAGTDLSLSSLDAVAKERDAAVALTGVTTGAMSLPGSSSFPTANPTSDFKLMNTVTPLGTDSGKLVSSGMPFGLEPNVDLDQRSDYITHLHRLRRINLGDDNADSAGYGLYLMRVPLSIQPGDHTKKGFGAIVNLTVSHDFNPRFLQSTYRNLVINDLVDKLSPVVHEMIRSGIAWKYDKGSNELARSIPTGNEADLLRNYEGIVSRSSGAAFVLNRSETRRNAIAPSDLARVFQVGNLLHLAVETQQAIGVFRQPDEVLVADALLSRYKAQTKPSENERSLTTGEITAAYKARSQAEAAANNLIEPTIDAINKLTDNERASVSAHTGVNIDNLINQWEGISRKFASNNLVASNVPGGVDVTDSGELARMLGEFQADAEDAAAKIRDKSDESDDANQQANLRNLAEKIDAVAQNIPPSRKAFEQASEAETGPDRAKVDEDQDDIHEKIAPLVKKVRLTDVRSYLRHELEAAYDLVDGHCRWNEPVLQDVAYVESLVDNFYCRKFDGVGGDDSNSGDQSKAYKEFVARLPGDGKNQALRDQGLGVLAWGITLEAGLLNRHLQEDMKQTKGANDYAAPPDIDTICFYVPEPPEETARAFQDYIKARWPVITFALEPMVDQQNIEDAFTRRRDLQLAVAFALASGRLSFRQAMTYTRNLQYEAQTIALNQTVAAFANGNDTFGWRITPRYQTPPEESNFQALTNTIFRGGPGPNWQLANSKIEPGMRELTAVIVMPSFVHGVRVDTAGDWFRLSDPETRKLRSVKAVEIGRRINEARDCLEAACAHANYRSEDVERLRVRLRQLESMLPLQTAFVRVPYENTLGGFALFSQGKTDLVPELVGFDGLDYIDTTKPTDLIIYGRNFSLYETAVVVGGKSLVREGARSYVMWDKDGKPFTLSSLTSPIRNDKGEMLLQILGTDGKAATVTIPDPGSFLIQSREIMRLRIPAQVAKVKRADGSEAVEVNVSTPTGVSNRLLIPVRPEPAAKAPAPSVIARAGSAAILDPTITVRYTAKFNDQGAVAPGARLGVAGGTAVRIFPKDVDHLSKEAEVSFVFPVTKGDAKSTLYNAIRIAGVPLNNGSYVLGEANLNELARRIEEMLKQSGMAPAAGATIETSEVTLLIPDLDPSKKPHGLTSTNPLTIKFEFVVVQAPGTASPTTAAVHSPAPAPRRDDQARTTSDERIVIPPPARPLNLDDLPALPQSQPWDAETDADEPFEEAADALPPDAPFERLAPRVAFQEAADAPAPAASPVVTPTAAPPATTTPPTQDNRPATVVIPPPVVPQTIVVAPQPPSVNVSVPITNVAKPPRQGLFHRDREPATPQNPARRSLLQRAINGP